jgi:hypothetical protein
MTYDRLFLVAIFVATIGECTGLSMRSTVRGRGDTCPRSRGEMHTELGGRLRCVEGEGARVQELFFVLPISG